METFTPFGVGRNRAEGDRDGGPASVPRSEMRRGLSCKSLFVVRFSCWQHGVRTVSSPSFKPLRRLALTVRGTLFLNAGVSLHHGVPMRTALCTLLALPQSSLCPPPPPSPPRPIRRPIISPIRPSRPRCSASCRLASGQACGVTQAKIQNVSDDLPVAQMRLLCGPDPARHERRRGAGLSGYRRLQRSRARQGARSLDSCKLQRPAM